MDDATIPTPKPPRKLANRRREPKPNCSVDSCGRPSDSKGMCAMHHTRFRRHGNTEGLLDSGTPLERFHKKYAINPATGCWEWACYRHPMGYGIMGIGKRKRVRAHRFAYEQFVGPIPAGMLVCHRCDVRHCVYPGHLFLGSDQDNIRDMVAKGRRGKTGRKLTWPMVTNIRVMYARGHPYVGLADLYGVEQETIRQVVKGLTWLDPPASGRLDH